MEKMKFVALDIALTGKKIQSVIKGSGYSVKEIQGMLGLSCPQAVYKWMRGHSLPFSGQPVHDAPDIWDAYGASCIIQI